MTWQLAARASLSKVARNVMGCSGCERARCAQVLRRLRNHLVLDGRGLHPIRFCAGRLFVRLQCREASEVGGAGAWGAVVRCSGSASVCSVETCGAFPAHSVRCGGQIDRYLPGSPNNIKVYLKLGHRATSPPNGVKIGQDWAKFRRYLPKLAHAWPILATLGQVLPKAAKFGKAWTGRLRWL